MALEGPRMVMETIKDPKKQVTQLQDQLQDNRWGSYVRDLLREGFNVAKGGVDMGDRK